MTHAMTSLLTSLLPMLGALTPPGTFPWLTLVTFAPLMGVLALMLMPREQKQALRTVTLIVTLLVFCISLGPMLLFDPMTPFAAGPFTFQMSEGPVDWIPMLGIHYALGVDGISLWLVMLTTFLMPIVILSTYGAVEHHIKEYMICLLLLETAMLGALLAMDVFLFYIFWEMMLIPMYFIIGVWGGEDKIRASVKFFIYTLVGSLLMLLAILYVYFKVGAAAGQYSFLFSDLAQVSLTQGEQTWLFLAFFLAFAIKVPLFPFHTWLPLAHVQAPTAGSVVLAGVMLKMGTYGLIRYAFPLFPDAFRTFAPYIACLSVIGILYGAIVAMVQPDVKKIVAYSSVSHLGFCVLGLVAMTPQAVSGALFIMLAHGIATGGLFLCVGILYERRHTKKIAAFGGVAKSMPVFSALFMIIVMASVGLPGPQRLCGRIPGAPWHLQEPLSLLWRRRGDPDGQERGGPKCHRLGSGDSLFPPAKRSTDRPRMDRHHPHRVCHPRRDLCRRLPALDVAPRDVWTTRQRGEPRLEGCLCQGDHLPCADRRHGDHHGRGAKLLLEPHGTLGEPVSWSHEPVGHHQAQERARGAAKPRLGAQGPAFHLSGVRRA